MFLDLCLFRLSCWTNITTAAVHLLVLTEAITSDCVFVAEHQQLGVPSGEGIRVIRYLRLSTEPPDAPPSHFSQQRSNRNLIEQLICRHRYIIFFVLVRQRRYIYTLLLYQQAFSSPLLSYCPSFFEWTELQQCSGYWLPTHLNSSSPFIQAN